MNRGRQRRSEDTVRYILDATEQIRAGDGLPAVTMRRVADVAGVGLGTLYHHFPDRASLLRAAERRAWQAEFELLVANIPPIDPSAADSDAIDDAVPALVGFAVQSVLRRIDAVGVTMDDPDLQTAMFGMFDETAEILTRTLAPVAARLRRPDVTASLRMATETLALMSWIAALRHRDRVASGEFQRELGDMLSRYLLNPRAR